MSTWIDEKDLLGKYGLPSDDEELFSILSQRGTKSIIRTGKSTLYELESIPKRIQSSLEKNGFTPIDPDAVPAQSASSQAHDAQDSELDWDDAIQDSQNESADTEGKHTEPDAYSEDMFSENATEPESDSPTQKSEQSPAGEPVRQPQSTKLTATASGSKSKTQNTPTTKQESSMAQQTQTGTVNLEKTNMVLELLNLNDAEWREISRQTFRRILESADSATLMVMQAELVADMQAVTSALQSKITG